MTVAAPRTGAPLELSATPHGLEHQLNDIVVLTGRNLVHIAREPLQLSDVTIQPVLFTALFVSIFDAGVVRVWSPTTVPDNSIQTRKVERDIE